MGRRTWIKIFSDNWLRGTLREETAGLRGIWIDILALAGDSAFGDTGKIQLGEGVGFTDEQIAGVLKVKFSEWVDAKQRLVETERIRIHAGNIIEIVNWGKYQSDYQRQMPYRKLQKKVTEESYNGKLQRDIDRDIDGDKDTDTDEEVNISRRKYCRFFEDRWEKYPNKDGKKKARMSFLASVRNEKDLKRFDTAFNNYLNSPRVKKGFIKNGSTFFANWEDWIRFETPEEKQAGENIDKMLGKKDWRTEEEQ